MGLPYAISFFEFPFGISIAVPGIFPTWRCAGAPCLFRKQLSAFICGGLAAFFGIDATWIRLVWAFGTLCSVGLGLVAYFVAAIIIPEEIAP